MRIAINGLGRIGRLFLRQALQYKDIEIVAVNDLVPPDNLAYLLTYDSTHGRIKQKVEARESSLLIEGKEIAVYNSKQPKELPWAKHKIDYVVESTGHFTEVEAASQHLIAGAKRVIISAPAKGDHIPTYVMGVNEHLYKPSQDKIISMASCTTNCLAVLTKVLLENYGIEEGLMTTIHALTATQPTVDGPSKRDPRGGRGALQNVIPASTGAAKAVSLCLPEVKGKLTGMAFRVPVADVSVVDLTVRLSQGTTLEDICQKLKNESLSKMKGILLYCEDEVVSSDFISSPYSAIFDAKASMALNNQFYKLIAWYDNEMGYSTRLVDLIRYLATKE